MMETDEKMKARQMLEEWKKDSYIFGLGVLGKVGEIAKEFGDNTLLIASSSGWARKHVDTIIRSLKAQNISCNLVRGARPNCPREDLYRIALQVSASKPDSIIAFGGGSTIDGAKAASVLATYSPAEVSEVFGVDWGTAGSIDPYFGTGMVTKIKKATKKEAVPVIAVQSASSSAAHLTKYSNITDPIVGQKKLIVDEAITPKKSVFDYGVTIGAPRNLTLDGGLDGIAHLWEVFMGATGKDYYEKEEEVASLGLSLIIGNLKKALTDDVDARVALGLGTDLGGYSIMIGGTNGPHLGSFSLVDVLSHGRACAILNPYYTMFFSPSIQDQLVTIGRIFQRNGLIKADLDLESLSATELGRTVAKGMLEFNRTLGFPTTLKEAGATEAHLTRMLEAAKDPQLKMKLLNMPVPLDPAKGDIDNYMKSILEAAFTGDLGKIKLPKTS
ncbi:3-dehydroquinate synthase [Candidatus Bathyarchaeota archaeon ex4484_231]|nr:MAG: 3-dehydroquinate synthase [Candidatus Bathyarchaeota archaeon ex4484_231]